MKVYVDELPETCGECPCFQTDSLQSFCLLYWIIHRKMIGGDVYQDYKKPNCCPLKLLKDHDRAVKQHAYKKGYNDMRIQYELGDYTKQVRKEVCEEIRAEFEPKTANHIDENTFQPTSFAVMINKGFRACKERLFKKLDEIEQGETNE